MQGGGISQWGPLLSPASSKEKPLGTMQAGADQLGSNPAHAWRGTWLDTNDPEISRTGKDNSFMDVLDKPTEKMGRVKIMRKKKQFYDESCSDYNKVECKFPINESQQQHHQPALHESKLQLVLGTDTRIPWEAAFQGKGPWHSWLVFQDSFLKPKIGSFLFTGK